MAGGGGAGALVTLPLSIGAAERRNAAQRKALKGTAALRDKQAKEVVRQTRRESNIFKRKGEVVMGDQVSKFAKAGVDLSGSALLVLSNTRRELETERRELERKGLAEADLLRQGASSLRTQAKRVKRAGTMEAFGTVLGTGGQIAASFSEEE